MASNDPPPIETLHTNDAAIIVESNCIVEELSQKEKLEGKQPRLRSKIWEELRKVTLPSGEVKIECPYCHTLYKQSKTGSTSTLNRHLNSCMKRAKIEKSQQQITIECIPEEEKAFSISNYKYDKDRVRRVLAKLIIVDEKPFISVESKLFNLYSKALQPRHEKWSRHSVKRECMIIYAEEKEKLKKELNGVNLVCLTTDAWTSRRTKAYITLTAHYVSTTWKLQKRIQNFRYFPPPHSGQSMANLITEFLREWGLEHKVFTITVDNASSNDSMVKILKQSLIRSGHLHLSQIFHVRCCAHVLNLVVQCGLEHIKSFIHDIRESVKYIKSSTSRKSEFETSLAQYGFASKKELVLDVSTRWNSTYHMLRAAKEVKPAFKHYAETDSNYKWFPTDEEWDKYEDIEELLEKFYLATELFSGIKYPTSNLFLPVIWKVKSTLHKTLGPGRLYMKEMIEFMKEKFDKYWSECNTVLAIANILDPRCKLMVVAYCFPLLYSADEAERKLDHVKGTMKEIYEVYEIKMKASKDLDEPTIKRQKTSSSSSFSMLDDEAYNLFVANYEKNKESTKSELDDYLEDSAIKVPSGNEFDVLEYWKNNEIKYKALSSMARDILSIPLSTVASESAFSTGERLISDVRSRLNPKTVEALICTQDWLRPFYDSNEAYEENENDEE